MKYTTTIIKPKAELLETLMEQGNVHEELNGDKYLYFPFCFKLTASGIMVIELIENVPDHVKAVMLKLGFKPNQ